MAAHPIPSGSEHGEKTPRRVGRPIGSTRLTDEIQDTIVHLVRAGAFDYAAAEAAGISARTFHEWIQRGAGEHPDRPATPRLEMFARAVRQASAEARVAAEVKVYREKPAHWLKYSARTTEGREGWTEPTEASQRRSESETLEIIRRLDEIDNAEETIAAERRRQAPVEAMHELPPLERDA